LLVLFCSIWLLLLLLFVIVSKSACSASNTTQLFIVCITHQSRWLLLIKKWNSIDCVPCTLLSDLLSSNCSCHYVLLSWRWYYLLTLLRYFLYYFAGYGIAWVLARRSIASPITPY
jgi:hypothetical protein